MDEGVSDASQLHSLHTCQKVLQFLHALNVPVQLRADDL